MGKMRKFESGWDRDCLFNIKDGDRILVEWADGAESFEVARVSSAASYGQEQGTFSGQSYMGTRHELFAERKVHGRKTEINLDGLYVYAESMDTWEQFLEDREKEREAKRVLELSMTHVSIMPSDSEMLRDVKQAIDKLSKEREDAATRN